MLLLKKVAWSANITEQGHAAASLVMKQHGRLTKEMMPDRALILSARPLFGKMRDQTHISSLESQLESCQSKQVNRITGRHMFIRDIHASDQARKEASMNLSTRLGSHSLVLPFVNHQASLSWRDMGSDRKQQYNDQAEDERLDQFECSEARKMKLIIKLAALRTSLTGSDNFSDQPLRLS